MKVKKKILCLTEAQGEVELLETRYLRLQPASLLGGDELGLPGTRSVQMASGADGKPEAESGDWVLAGRRRCPFRNPWIDKARKLATEVAWVEGLLFVLQEQQELFSSTAEQHIPTGSLMKNKNTTTSLHCIWFLPFQPVWTRRTLLLAFVTVNSWVAWRGSVGWWKGHGGRAGLKSSRACWLYELSHLLDVFKLYLVSSFIKGE